MMIGEARSDLETKGECNLRDNSNVKIAGIITGIKKKFTKNNKLMAFVTIEDLYGSCESIVFENVYNNYSDLLYEESIVLIEGRLSIREDRQDITITIIPSKITDINDAKQKNEKSKKLVLNITDLDEEHKEKLRGAIRFFSGDRNNLPVFVKQGEKISSCGAIFANEDTIKEFEEIVGKENVKNWEIIIIIILVIVLAGLVFIHLMKNNNESITSNQTMIGEPPDGMPGSKQSASSAESVETKGATIVDGKEENLEENYETSNEDESVILVQNGGNATITGATISKNGGDSSNTENSEFYGVNSGVLVKSNSTATIKNATITTNAKGSNAVFSTGTDSKIYINDSTITTTGSSSSRGLDATYGGYIEADNVKIKTQGGSCATLATDRGEGTIIAKNSTLETNGAGSPIIYSTGNISISNTTGTANGSQTVVIEGKNSATVENSTLTCSGKGNRGDTDHCGVMIYQSMSGDAGEGTGTFTANNSSLEIMENSDYYKTAPMFFITNTDAVINLNNTKLKYGSNTLISAKGTSEWGKTGSNGGNISLNVTNQELDGNIEIDNISTLSMKMSSSTYSGTINGENTAKQIELTLDSNSKIKLTGDSYITSLNDEDETYSNIDFNGFKLYVNGKAIN